MTAPNPTGKGGFRDHPENRASGRWSTESSFSYWYNKFKDMSVKEFEEWSTSNPKEDRKVAADLAYTRIIRSRSDLKEFQEVADRSEGKARQAVDITSGGEKIVPATIVDLGNIHSVTDQPETEQNS